MQVSAESGNSCVPKFETITQPFNHPEITGNGVMSQSLEHLLSLKDTARRALAVGASAVAAFISFPESAQGQGSNPANDRETIVALLDTSASPMQHPLVLPGLTVSGAEDPAMPNAIHATQMTETIFELFENNGAVRKICEPASCKIMPIKAIEWKDGSFAINTAQAIDTAVANGADVVNMSFTGPGSPEITQAIDTAIAAGIIVVNAAGNQGADAQMSALAANNPNLIVVGGLDSSETDLLEISNRSESIIDVAAKGTLIRIQEMGTSVASAYVAALATAAKRLNPNINQNELIKIIQENGRALPSLVGKVACGCKLDVSKFLNAMGYREPEPPAPPKPASLTVSKYGAKTAGNITVNGKTCKQSRCNYTFTSGRSVTLRVKARSKASVAKWTGACRNAGRKSFCQIKLDGNRKIGVFLRKKTY